MPGEAPSVSESNILPRASDSRDVELFLSLKTYFEENNNAVESLLKRVSTSKTAAYTIDGSDYLVLADSTAGSFSITLPLVEKHKGQKFVIKQIGSANTVTIDGDGTETIDGALTQAITTQYDFMGIISDGTEWWIIHQND